MTTPRGTRSLPGHSPTAESTGQAPRSGALGLGQPHHAEDQIPLRRRRSRHRGTLVLWGFLVPALLVFAYFKFYPIGYGVWLSFQDVGIMGNNRFVGLENFNRAIEDTLLHDAFWHTVVYVAIGVTLSVLIGFGLALALAGQARHIRLVRTTVFLPAVVTVAVCAEVFRILYHPTPDGPLNWLLGLVNLGPVGFTSDPNTSLVSVIGMHVWKNAPYDMVVLIAALAGVDRSLYESARVDGANWAQRLWFVTIPSIRFAFTIVITLGVIRGMRVFPEVYTLTGGGPARSSEVIMTYVYRVSFVEFDIGYAAALSTLLFVLTVVLTAATMLFRRERS